MYVGRPVSLPKLGIVWIAETSDVVGQGIEPDVHHVIAAGGHRDAPVEAGAGNAEILETAFDETNDLVSPALGTDKFRVRGIKLEQRLLVPRQAEEPAFLNGPFDRRALRRQLRAVIGGDQLVSLVISLVADRVPTLVSIEIEVPPLLHRLPDRLARTIMVGLRGPDEPVVGHVE